MLKKLFIVSVLILSKSVSAQTYQSSWRYTAPDSVKSPNGFALLKNLNKAILDSSITAKGKDNIPVSVKLYKTEVLLPCPECPADKEVLLHEFEYTNDEELKKRIVSSIPVDELRKQFLAGKKIKPLFEIRHVNRTSNEFVIDVLDQITITNGKAKHEFIGIEIYEVVPDATVPALIAKIEWADVEKASPTQAAYFKNLKFKADGKLLDLELYTDTESYLYSKYAKSPKKDAAQKQVFDALKANLPTVAVTPAKKK